MQDSQNSLGTGYTDRFLTEAEARKIVAQALYPLQLQNKRVLLIIPDSTRTAPVGLMFRAIYDLIGQETKNLDVMIALGTHQPMSEAAIHQRLEISAAERATKYTKVQFLNHAWDDPASLRTVGKFEAEEISDISEGLFALDVRVDVNRHIFDYDQLIIVGPVFPHEVVGFSGGNKYLFPGIGGPELLHFFHWLAAVISNPRTIGNKWTPVRRVVDRAGAMVTVPKLAFCMVVHEAQLAGLYAGTPEAAWSQAADLSDKLHIIYKEKPFHTVLSCAPPMYDELWVGGKCMYKLEPVVADGGELIIYAPHIREVSVTHGELIKRIGYHTRDYFLKQWPHFKDIPWSALAHSTHVRGIGTYEDGVEKPRIQVTLATGLSPQECAAINLGYRDPATINVEDFKNREAEGILYVPKAGEMLYRLQDPPAWARL